MRAIWLSRLLSRKSVTHVAGSIAYFNLALAIAKDLLQAAQRQRGDGCPWECFELPGIQRGFELGTCEVYQMLFFQVVGVAIGDVASMQRQEEMCRARAPIGIHTILT